jgi:hypothetical protein
MARQGRRLIPLSHHPRRRRIAAPRPTTGPGAGTADDPYRPGRGAGHRAAPTMTGMDITIHSSFLPQNDPDAALAFYRDIRINQLR